LASLEHGRSPSARPLVAREIPLTDRVEEIKLLRETVDRTIQGEGGLVFLCGEAGIGKTRLTRELGAYARLRGMQVLYGRCPALFRMDGVPPYNLWSEVIRDYLQTCLPEQLYKVIGFYPGELAKLAPEMGQKLGAIPQSLPINPEHERNRLFEAVSQFVTNVSREAPLLLVLDDLQWADSSSLMLLHYLARGAHRAPVLFLGAYRTTDVDSKLPLFRILAELNRERLLQSIPLKRMSLNDVSEMIKKILEQDDVPLEFCRLVYGKTRGNPFFAEETIKSLKEEDVIFREENRWKIKEATEIGLPETVKNAVKVRINRLDDDCKGVLTLAAFIGNEFTLQALCGVTNIEEDKVSELIEKMYETGLIEERVIHGESICSFSDVIVRDVVYEDISPFRRKKLHGIVGSALEKVYSNKIDSHLGELASHFLESGDKDNALDYFLKAGERAAKIYANNEAASYFKSALGLLEEKDEPQKRALTLEKLGNVERLAGKYDACIEHWNEALLLWTKMDQKLDTSKLHRKIASLIWHTIGDIEKAKEHHDKALKILEAEPESVELASLYEESAHMYYRFEDMPSAISSAEKALRIAQKLNAYEVTASSCVSLGTALAYSGETKKAIEYLGKALRIALDNGYVETALRAYNNFPLAFSAEENERSADCYAKGYELAKRVGDVYWQSMLGFNLAGVYFNMGNIEKFAQLGSETIALDRKTGNKYHLYASTIALMYANQILGESEKSEQYMKEALSVSEGLNDFQKITGGYDYFGLYHFDRGEYGKAKEFFEKLDKTLEKAGDKSSQLTRLPFLVRTHIELGEVENAQKLVDTIFEFASKAGDKDIIATADSLQAMIFRVQRRWEESIQFFEKSFQEFEAKKARQLNPYFFARFLLREYARALVERNQEGDGDKALMLLNDALKIFQKVGAKKDIEKTEADIIHLEGPRLRLEPVSTGHITMGNPDLDNLLYGGIAPNSAIVLTSPSCSERDQLIKSFIETGAKNGEVAFYLTINPGLIKMLAVEHPSNLHLFVCNPQADAIVKEAPNVVKLKGVENLTDISIALTSVIRKLDPSVKSARRICLGLVSDVLMQHHAVQTRRWLAGLIPELQSEGSQSWRP
jgi:tetratricopeptide (TPR) repeat protein